MSETNGLRKHQGITVSKTQVILYKAVFTLSVSVSSNDSYDVSVDTWNWSGSHFKMSAVSVCLDAPTEISVLLPKRQSSFSKIRTKSGSHFQTSAASP